MHNQFSNIWQLQTRTCRTKCLPEFYVGKLCVKKDTQTHTRTTPTPQQLRECILLSANKTNWSDVAKNPCQGSRSSWISKKYGARFRFRCSPTFTESLCIAAATDMMYNISEPLRMYLGPFCFYPNNQQHSRNHTRCSIRLELYHPGW